MVTECPTPEQLAGDNPRGYSYDKARHNLLDDLAEHGYLIVHSAERRARDERIIAECHERWFSYRTLPPDRVIDEIIAAAEARVENIDIRDNTFMTDDDVETP